MIPILKTELGQLYEGDCVEVVQSLDAETVDLAFADPPFNLGKRYTSGVDDTLTNEKYLGWCKQWMRELFRLLKPGGALFVWNLPKWNLALGNHGQEIGLMFRHWIAVSIKYSLPISKRLYPAHYSLLYFIKGDKAAIFHPDRLPVPCCRHCGGEIPDYGGYKGKMNPGGVNLSDVWTDIPPVRHKKYKKREANALPLKLMDRILSMASDPGSVVLDPFGGSGTTYVVAELLGRRWLGVELDCSAVVERFDTLNEDREYLQKIHSEKNTLFTERDLERRRKKGLTPLSPDYRLENQNRVAEQPENAEPSLFDVAI
jgi:site-specific DNA-methyltransferase (adenine-specific)